MKGLIPLATVLLAGLSAAAADTVQWHYIGDGPNPPAFTIDPPFPTTTNVVRFIAPTDGRVYGNSCFASLENGTPYIQVDSVTRSITVAFTPPPPYGETVCFMVVLPVSGIDGSIGPLPAGTWTFYLWFGAYPWPRIYSFEVAAVPVPLSLKAGVTGSSIELTWPLCGDSLVLECADNPLSQNWQMVTNLPAAVSGQNKLQINSEPGNRFYRLRRL